MFVLKNLDVEDVSLNHSQRLDLKYFWKSFRHTIFFVIFNFLEILIFEFWFLFKSRKYIFLQHFRPSFCNLKYWNKISKHNLKKAYF